MTEISGIWLPVITPFVDGEMDLGGYERLVEHYLACGVAGIFPLRTTGESPAQDEDEMEALVERTVRAVAGRVPNFVGVGGNATAKVLKTLARLERYPFARIVSVCPYYNRPGQDGLRAHFTRIAEATAREILIYNIPYRTSVNMANDTLLRLAELPNIVGGEGLVRQSRSVARDAPAPPARVRGHDGGRPGALHHAGPWRRRRHSRLCASLDRAVRRGVRAHAGKRPPCRAPGVGQPRVPDPAPLQGGQPMPIKHCLWRQGLIASPECRLPLTRISEGLAATLEPAWRGGEGEPAVHPSGTVRPAGAAD